MPSLKQLLTDAGATLPDGLDVSKLVESADEVSGLKAKRDELLNWQVTNKPLLESLQTEKAQLEQKAKEEEDKALELARQNGDFAKQAEITAKRLQELESGLNASRERTQKAALEAAQASVASLMNDPIYGKYYAEKSAVVELNELGEPITKFKFGEQVFDKLDDWKQAAIKDETVASKIAVGGANNAPSANGQQGGQGGGQQPQQPKLSNATKGYMANLQSQGLKHG